MIPGTIIGGRLRIEEMLGAGGMGIVASATHLELGNKVAVKFLREEYAQNATIVERFIREARAVVNLRTEHVCRVLDVGRLDTGAPYIVMEMLHGADLSRAIAQRPLPATTAVDYIMQACVALAEAHGQGIVHRDIKPANLFVTRRPDGGPLVKVLDFGIAKAMDNHGPALTHTSGMMGSPGYMSPEQLMSARDVDLRTDIWALGVTLYQLVSGRMPFAAPTITEIAIKVAADTPPPLDVDPGLSRVIFRCLEKSIDKRYRSIAELTADLSRFASSDGRIAIPTAVQNVMPVPNTAPAPVAVGAPTAASIADVPRPALPPSQIATSVTSRPKWPFIVGGLALVGATVGITLAMTGSSSKPAAAPPAPVAAATADAALAEAAPVAATAPVPAPELSTIARPDGGDAWATNNEPALYPDEEDEPAPKKKKAAPTATPKATGATGLELMTAEDKQTFARDCVDLNDPGIETLPQFAGIKVACRCANNDLPGAKKILAGIQDVSARQQAFMMCSLFGTPLQ